MTSERWQQIEALYNAVQERGLAALADADPELKSEVEALLAQNTAGILDRPAAELLDRATSSSEPGKLADEVLAGGAVSHYKLIERIGQGDGKIRPRQRILRIPAVDGIAREYRRIAEILSASATVRTCSIGTAEPGNTHPFPAGQFTDDLMTGNHPFANWPEFPFNYMQIGPADATSEHAHRHITRRCNRLWKIRDGKRTIRNLPGHGQYRGAHGSETQHGAGRLANNFVGLTAQPPKRRVHHSAAEHNEIGVYLLRHLTDRFRHSARFYMHCKLCSGFALKTVHVIARGTNQKASKFLAACIAGHVLGSRDGMNQTHTRIEFSAQLGGGADHIDLALILIDCDDDVLDGLVAHRFGAFAMSGGPHGTSRIVQHFGGYGSHQ